MSPEEQQIAILKAMGWTEDEPWLDGRRCFVRADSNSGWDFNDLPDYINDLNAMHEAEKWLYTNSISFINKDGLTAMLGNKEKTAWVVYLSKLNKIVNPRIAEYPTHYQDWARIHATAAQRAEAFLKALGKWEDVKGTLIQ